MIFESKIEFKKINGTRYEKKLYTFQHENDNQLDFLIREKKIELKNKYGCDYSSHRVSLRLISSNNERELDVNNEDKKSSDIDDNINKLINSKTKNKKTK